MTVWTRELTELALRYRLRARVDPAHLHPEEHARHAMERLALRAARDIREAFTTHAVDDMPHLEDFRVHTREDANTLEVEVLVQWLPEVTAVELVGGPVDGRVMEVPEPMRPGGYRVPHPRGGSPFTPRPGDAFTPSYDVLTYSLDSWNNTERRWRMTQDGTLT